MWSAGQQASQPPDDPLRRRSGLLFDRSGDDQNEKRDQADGPGNDAKPSPHQTQLMRVLADILDGEHPAQDRERRRQDQDGKQAEIAGQDRPARATQRDEQSNEGVRSGGLTCGGRWQSRRSGRSRRRSRGRPRGKRRGTHRRKERRQSLPFLHPRGPSVVGRKQDSRIEHLLELR